MANQLWLSPATGYRGKGTRLAELKSVIEAGVTARAAMEPLLSCAASASAVDMYPILRRHGFDVAGVQENEVGPVLGYVEVRSLDRGIVKDHLLPFAPGDLIAESTPLREALPLLGMRPQVFVLVGEHVAGILTPADLGKPPFRIYLFGLISLLEMHLTFWVKQTYQDGTWQERLSTGRLDAAQKMHERWKAQRRELDVIDCLQLCDKADLVVNHSEVANQLGLGPKTKARERLHRAEQLRNLLAHSQHDIVPGASWSELSELVAWIESVVHRSDECIERTVLATSAASSPE